MADTARVLAAPPRVHSFFDEHRALAVFLTLAAAAAVLVPIRGFEPVAQTTVNGFVSAATIGLGAVGLTLVFGVLRLVNFAHGDMLTFGAYAALILNVDLGLPFAATVFIAIAATAALGVAFEFVLWGPMRARGASTFQLLLVAIGLALLVRNAVQFFASGAFRRFEIDIVSSVAFGGLRIGTMQLYVVVIGVAVLVAVGLMLRHTWLGKEMRALADNFDLAETTGIDTRRIVLATWLLAAGLAGLAGVLYGASIGALNPNLGFSLLLSLFAAAVLGGIGNAYGALAGGIVIALAQEWSTLFFNPRWKPATGFVILLLTLLFMPQGLFGRRRAL